MPPKQIVGDPQGCIDEVIKKIVDSGININSAIPYGSAVNDCNNFTEASDIDIAIFPNPINTCIWDVGVLMEVGGIVDQISRKYDIPIEILPRSPEELEFATSTLMSTEFRQTALSTAKEYLIKGNVEVLPKIKEARDNRTYDRERENVERSCFFKRMTFRKNMVDLSHKQPEEKKEEARKQNIKEQTRTSISWTKKILKYSAAYLNEGLETPYSYYNKLDNAIEFFVTDFPKLKVREFTNKTKEWANNWKTIRDYPSAKLLEIHGADLNFIEKVFATTLCYKYQLKNYAEYNLI
jgi:hypothetical protein